MRDGRNVLDHRDLEASGLKGTQRGLAPGPRSLDVNTDHLHAVVHRLTSGVLSDELGGEGVVLATSNGRIVLELPDEVDAEVDMRVDNGVIRTLRELTTRRGDSAGRLRGKLGRGGAPIKLRTSNGTISLR